MQNQCECCKPNQTADFNHENRTIRIERRRFGFHESYFWSSSDPIHRFSANSLDDKSSLQRLSEESKPTDTDSDLYRAGVHTSPYGDNFMGSSTQPGNSYASSTHYGPTIESLNDCNNDATRGVHGGAAVSQFESQSQSQSQSQHQWLGSIDYESRMKSLDTVECPSSQSQTFGSLEGECSTRPDSMVSGDKRPMNPMYQSDGYTGTTRAHPSISVQNTCSKLPMNDFSSSSETSSQTRGLRVSQVGRLHQDQASSGDLYQLKLGSVALDASQLQARDSNTSCLDGGSNSGNNNNGNNNYNVPLNHHLATNQLEPPPFEGATLMDDRSHLNANVMSSSLSCQGELRYNSVSSYPDSSMTPYANSSDATFEGQQSSSETSRICAGYEASLSDQSSRKVAAGVFEPRSKGFDAGDRQFYNSSSAQVARASEPLENQLTNYPYEQVLQSNAANGAHLGAPVEGWSNWPAEEQRKDSFCMSTSPSSESFTVANNPGWSQHRPDINESNNQLSSQMNQYQVYQHSMGDFTHVSQANPKQASLASYVNSSYRGEYEVGGAPMGQRSQIHLQPSYPSDGCSNYTADQHEPPNHLATLESSTNPKCQYSIPL